LQKFTVLQKFLKSCDKQDLSVVSSLQVPRAARSNVVYIDIASVVV